MRSSARNVWSEKREVRVQNSVDKLIKTDQGSASVTTARARIGRAKRVRFEGGDKSDSEIQIQGVAVSKDSLIEAVFLRQRSLEQHERNIEIGIISLDEDQRLGPFTMSFSRSSWASFSKGRAKGR